MIENVTIKPHDAADVVRLKPGTLVQWSNHGDEWSPVMRVVRRGVTIVNLRPLRFYERWFYRGDAVRVLAWRQPIRFVQ